MTYTVSSGTLNPSIPYGCNPRGAECTCNKNWLIFIYVQICIWFIQKITNRSNITSFCLWIHVQDEIVTGFKIRLEQENRRYKTLRRQLRQQKSEALRQWYSVRSFLVSEHGVWTDRSVWLLFTSAHINSHCMHHCHIVKAAVVVCLLTATSSSITFYSMCLL